MNKIYWVVVFISLFIVILDGNAENSLTKRISMHLWYKQPALAWREALPIGNGRLGAMIFGGIKEETIALNEVTMWSGRYDENQQKTFGQEKLKELRKVFFKDDIEEGNRIASEYLAGTPHSFGTHLPVGNLKISFLYPEGGATDYKRILDLNNAVSTVSFVIGHVKYKREYFASNPAEVIVIRFSASKSHSLNLKLVPDLLRKADIEIEKDQLCFKGKVDFPKQGEGGVCFEGRIAFKVRNGIVKYDRTDIELKKADAVTLIIDIRTDYKNRNYRSLCTSTVKRALAEPYRKLKSDHMNDYSRLFGRVKLKLNEGKAPDLPTDERWKSAGEEKTDPVLDALFFQYGRYLTIASSRENSPLPIALQGFFNDDLACNMGWTNDYHLDINTEQNYWLSNVGNLAECNLPLFKYIRDLSVYGSRTAKMVYGCRGWTAHTTANVWGYTAPSGNIGWGLFPTAGSWIASHLWVQYEYTKDKAFLAKTAYPLLKGNAEFLLDYLTTDPRNGYLVTGPGISPENSFYYEGKEYCASMMPTCDRELVDEIFSSCIKSADILHKDIDFADSLKEALKKLPPLRIGKDGGIQEWLYDYKETHPNHRHTSHLLALYPFDQITPEKTPELAKAARKTIDLRLAAKGWEDTEWSRANMLCFFARLKDPDAAYESLKKLEGSLSRENLLTVSPVGIAGADNEIFAIDGNTAGAAGIAEMLVQSDEGYMEFLPCLPKEWNSGEFHGICVKGGAEVSSGWTKSKIDWLAVKATADNKFVLKIPEGEKNRAILNGKKILVDINDKGLFMITMKKNDVFEMKLK